MGITNRKVCPLACILLSSVDALPEDPTTAEPQTTLERENENPDEVDESGVKVLSKKEKEKLKKEREKVVDSLLPCYVLIESFV